MNKKTVVIHQPDFIPYLGFFDRLLKTDLYVVFDNVQYLDRGWMNRDKIKTPKGAKWITISVQKAPRETKINEMLLSTEVDWRTQNLNFIKENYRNALYFEEVFPYIQEMYNFRTVKMVDFNMNCLITLLKLFAINVEMIWASSLNPSGKSNELLVDILKKVNATTYLSGVGAKDYYDPAPFAAAGIEVIWQDFKHPVYPQLHGEFIPFLSSIDLLLNCGIEQSRRILRSC